MKQFPPPRIETIAAKKLLGLKERTNLAEQNIQELWRRFRSMEGYIELAVPDELISMRVYSSDAHFDSMDVHQNFDQWAAKEVYDWPKAMEQTLQRFEITSGLYAVFTYKGASNDFRIFAHIFGVWLPQSGYEIDDRPHFEILGKLYKNNDADSEEEIYIPIRIKMTQAQ